MASREGGPKYSIAELSDGERNALLIASNVLTAKPDTLILVDEPERHLHRSIISPLLTLLFAKRPDCAFVISTHDVELPLDNPGADTLLVRACVYSGSAVVSWDADLVASGADIDDALKRDILGSRKKVLFVEGVKSSLDKPLYSLVFPGVSVVPKESCRDVEHAVSGIREADTFHWLHAFGIVDSDRRTEADIQKLKENGIYALSAYSVESIYYHPTVQSLVAKRQAEVTGENADERLAQTKSECLQSIAREGKRMAERAAEKVIREQIFARLPTRKSIATGSTINISVTVADLVAEELARFENAIATEDLALVITQYPVRETPALDKIAKGLGFQSREQYEGAVRKLMADSDEALEGIKSFFGTLPEDLKAL